jgi:dienelactone hydrolase
MTLRRAIAVLAVGLGAMMAADRAAAMGALAYKFPDSTGYAYDRATADEAREAALAMCPGCHLIAVFQGTCAAYAVDRRGTGIYGLGWHPGNKTRAQNLAVEACRENGGTDCALKVWACESRIRNDSSAWVINYSQPARPDNLVEEKVYLRTRMGNQTVRLEALFIKPAAAQGRLPIALVNHGRPNSPIEALNWPVTMMRTIGRDMARRGWLAVVINRRGFGMSDGSLQAQAPKCEKDTLISWMYSDGDELLAALELIVRRPDADPTRILSIGHSAGGGATMALAARNPAGLVGAVNLSGGETWSGCPVENFIPADFKGLGATNRVPNLWFFAENDPSHPPSQVKLMQDSFVGAGADLRLVQLGPLGDDGHAGMLQVTGRTQWLAELDGFLRARNLPTWRLDTIDVVLRKLRWGANSRPYVERYLGAPGEKALARTPNSGNASFNFGATIDDARSNALKSCQAKGQPCQIVMENNVWVGPN